MAERTYTPEELRVIIRKAMELEARINAEQSGSNGLTREEVFQVAREAGISEDLIKTVMDEQTPDGNGRHLNASAMSDEAKTVIRAEEISVEQWISIDPDAEVIELLLTELDNRFHTSDKESWWSSIWGDNVKIKKTNRSTEWKFTDKNTDISTRVLLQSRGNRFRIRVSRRQNWGVGWDVLPKLALLPFPSLAVIGGIFGYTQFDYELLSMMAGIGIGLITAAAAYPFLRRFVVRVVQKHSDELTELMDELVDYAMELHDEVQQEQPKSRVTENKRSEPAVRQNVRSEDSEQDSAGGSTGYRLKNQLRG